MEIINQKDLMLPLHSASVFQILRAGVELEIFEILHSKKKLSLKEIAKKTKLRIEPAKVQMIGMKEIGLVKLIKNKYRNCKAITKYFEKGEYNLFKKMALLQAYIMYLGQAYYVESLKLNTNIGINMYEGIGKTIYEKLSKNPKLGKIFYDYMEAYSAYAIPYLIKTLDLRNVKNLLDAGGGGGNNAIAIAKSNPEINIILFELPHLKERVEINFKKNEVSNKAKFQSGDLFRDKFPKNQDCILYIHQLMIWGPEQNKLLLKKAYDSLNNKGKVVLFGSIGDHKKNSLMAALDSVYFRAIAAGQGRIYPSAYYKKQLKEAGFKKVEIIHCDTWTPHGIIIGYK